MHGWATALSAAVVEKRQRTAAAFILKWRNTAAHSGLLTCGERQGSISAFAIDLRPQFYPTRAVAFVGTGRITQVMRGLLA